MLKPLFNHFRSHNFKMVQFFQMWQKSLNFFVNPSNNLKVFCHRSKWRPLALLLLLFRLLLYYHSYHSCRRWASGQWGISKPVLKWTYLFLSMHIILQIWSCSVKKLFRQRYISRNASSFSAVSECHCCRNVRHTRESWFREYLPC